MSYKGSGGLYKAPCLCDQAALALPLVLEEEGERENLDVALLDFERTGSFSSGSFITGVLRTEYCAYGFSQG